MNYLEMLTRLGIGSAHPGGFSATLSLFDSLSVAPGSSVLEAGCGTGRTSCLLAQRGFRVTAIDMLPEMIEKARKRSELMQVDVDFFVGDISALPFSSDQFDMVVAESVTNFAAAERAVAEYYRVLKPGGALYDREVVRLKDSRKGGVKELISFFGFAQLLTAEQWMEVLKSQHFYNVRYSDVTALSCRITDDDQEHPDDHQFVSEGALLDVSLFETSMKYTDLMYKGEGVLGSALLAGVK